MSIQPTTTSAAIKWHGGKQYLADRIIDLMAPHVHYVEPFFGGGAVLLAKDGVGISEVVNDLNGELMNFWAVLADPSWFQRMQRILEATPCSEGRFDLAALNDAKRRELWPDRIPDDIDPVSRAVDFFILCRQSRAATFKDFTTLAKTRTRRGMNELPSAWLTAIEGLPSVHERLKRVVMLSRDALHVIRTQDGPAMLFYCDPPYLPETRATPDLYAKEMSKEQHAALLQQLAGIRGKFLLSGYDNELYRDFEKRCGWRRQEFELPNNAAGGDTKRRMIEVVWKNY